MADLDDLREGADFGLGINCENQSFHVKGAENLPWGMKDRLSRIFNPKTGKAVMLAFDHGFIMGPTISPGVCRSVLRAAYRMSVLFLPCAFSVSFFVCFY